MIIFPAIDLVNGEAVRLYKGDFAQKTVYSRDPLSVARDFLAAGAEYIHLVDLDGARTGKNDHFELICRIKAETGLFVETGGGIRTRDAIERYLSRGVDRVILGTVAVTDPTFVPSLPADVVSHVAVGVDVKDGKVAIKGWTETAAFDLYDFCLRFKEQGVDTVICTDISRDGAMMGSNNELYRELTARTGMKVIASGGVSSIEDVKRLKEGGAYGAIVGKAYYIGAIDLSEAIEVAK
ncbi:MAG: 1-(5-phosphoribosyl)-5-[(5-phosphoribosylamino)methylideneamino]imidazole-4-carboxamide isomerase [Clostridia bacterium]|nr:1-(5-phosphoribosyl)-5-[(5-phosphoribosylamino)methylideneamino]imidazole-4-carboxamide isomerase [Clostridia bacterium]